MNKNKNYNTDILLPIEQIGKWGFIQTFSFSVLSSQKLNKNEEAEWKG